MMGGTLRDDSAEADGLLDGVDCRCIVFSIHSSLDSCLSSRLTTLLRVLLISFKVEIISGLCSSL